MIEKKSKKGMKQKPPSYLKLVQCWLCIGLFISNQSWAESSEFNWSGVHRIRYEHLTNQFRTNLSGNDEALALRTLLKAEWKKNEFGFTAELEDSRLYLNEDENNVTGTSFVNTLELLQANVSYRFHNVFTENDAWHLRAGRMTQNLGSRRLVPRNNFRNTIQNYTGVRSEWSGEHDQKLTSFFVLPVLIQPQDNGSLVDHEVEFDEEDFDLRLWGLHYAWNTTLWNARAELYLVGLNEVDDPSERETLNRNLYTPGIRFYRPPDVGAWDFDIENILQFGQRHLTRAARDTEDLNVFAHFHHAEFGYTWNQSWSPRLSLHYDFASGDSGKSGEYHRFDTLFGPRRGEFGPTSIFGLLSRNNINSVGLRLNLKPHSRLETSLFWRANYTDEPTDAFARTGLVNTALNSRFAGHLLEGRIRYWLWPKRLRFDGGVTWFQRGEFFRTADNQNGEGDPFYYYSQLEWFFGNK